VPITNWTNPTPGTLLDSWGAPLNAILNLVKSGLNALELALGAVADNDDATAVAAKMPGIMGGRRLVLEPALDEGALWLRGVADTGIVNVVYVDDYGRAPIAWIQNAGGFGINDRISIFRNILGLPNLQADIYGYLRRNGRADFVWSGPPGNMLTHADATAEIYEGARSASLGTWQIPFGAGAIALHSESAGVTTPSGAFSSVRLTATGASLFGVTSTGVFGYPVTAGLAYSVVGNVRRVGATARTVQWGIQWYDGAGVFISQAYGSATATTQDAWVEVPSGSLTAPGGAAFASPILQVATTANGEAFDLGGVGLSRGAQTEFAPPFVGSGSYGTWGEAAAGDGWAHAGTGERWLCTTGGVPWLQVWEQLATRLSTSNGAALGTAAAGSSALPARGDHVHPTTGLAPLVAAPASAAASGTAGQISYDASFFYVCTAANTWRRVAHATW
jgi:hypothetical protein